MKSLTLVVMVLMVAAFTVAMGGEVYKVGGAAGWTNIGHVDYKTWASTKLFQVGDTIVFEYNKEFQNVARVSYTDFLTCAGAAHYPTSASGNYSFPITFPGHYYFICTIPGHCESGQKVDIRVPVSGKHSTPPSSSAHIQPLPFPYPPPSVPSRSPVNPPPSPSLQPAPTQSPTPAPTQLHSVVPTQSPSLSSSKSPSEVPTKSPSPAPSQSTSTAPPQSPSTAPPQSTTPSPPQSSSPAPSLLKESPPSTPAIPSPEVAPAPHKSAASELVSKVKAWSTLIAVFFYLIGFSF